MPHHTKTSVAATLPFAGLMAFLTMPEATAQERITLETIGAVRMARFEEVRGANPEFRPSASGAGARSGHGTHRKERDSAGPPSPSRHRADPAKVPITQDVLLTPNERSGEQR